MSPLGDATQGDDWFSINPWMQNIFPGWHHPGDMSCFSTSLRKQDISQYLLLGGTALGRCHRLLDANHLHWAMPPRADGSFFSISTWKQDISLGATTQGRWFVLA